MEKGFNAVWRIGVIFVLIYIAVQLNDIAGDAEVVADAVPAIEQDVDDAQDRLDSMSDRVNQANTNIRRLWTIPFCYSATEDSVMVGCIYEDGGWYRENNGDGFGVDPE